jgi:hypothetical protein
MLRQWAAKVREINLLQRLAALRGVDNGRKTHSGNGREKHKGEVDAILTGASYQGNRKRSAYLNADKVDSLIWTATYLSMVFIGQRYIELECGSCKDDTWRLHNLVTLV